MSSVAAAATPRVKTTTCSSSADSRSYWPPSTRKPNRANPPRTSADGRCFASAAAADWDEVATVAEAYTMGDVRATNR